MDYVYSFVIGGAFCIIGQLLIDKTNLTPAKILVGYVVSGVVLTAVGAYGWLAETFGAGATVPLTGFGYSLAIGVEEAVDKYGIIGVLTGGLTATSAGIAAAILFGVIVSLIFKPKRK